MVQSYDQVAYIIQCVYCVYGEDVKTGNAFNLNNNMLSNIHVYMKKRNQIKRNARSICFRLYHSELHTYT